MKNVGLRAWSVEKCRVGPWIVEIGFGACIVEKFRVRSMNC